MVPKINKINTENLDLIYGMVMGDGCLNVPKTRGRNARLSIFHCPKQKEYIEWKSKILNDAGFNSQVKFRPTDRYPQYILWTNHHPFLTGIYSEIYMFRNTPEKKRKRITRKLLDRFTIRTLAIWYLDDGHNRHKQNSIYLSTDEFTFEEQKLISEWIYKLTGAYFKIYRRKTHYYLATFRGTHTFLDAITEHCPDLECMKYKLIKREYQRAIPTLQKYELQEA